MMRLSFFLRELPLAAAICCMTVPAALSASAAWAGDAAGKSSGGNSVGSGAGKDSGRNVDGQATRQTKSLYTFERGLNGELIVRDASGRRVGAGMRDEVSTVRTQDR